MKRFYLVVLLLSLSIVTATNTTRATAPGSYIGDPYADRVTSYTLGTGGGYGEQNMPDNVLGPPHGNADSREPEDRMEHLLSLGDGGGIVVEFRDNICVDGPGPDLVIFENAFADDSDLRGSFYIETAIVSVSADGENYYTFPYDFNLALAEATKIGNRYFFSPDLFSGLAGVHPTYASYENTISPVDPNASGGDFFDLADVGLTGVRFVKIVDTGRPKTLTEVRDDDGDVIDDTGNGGYDPLLMKFGFDLDAIAAIHSERVTGAGAEWSLY